MERLKYMIDLIQDLFMQMWQGNLIAWLAFTFFIVVVGLVALLGIIWWKMPQPAKKMFLNNLIGHRPMFANSFDNKVTRFQTPRIFGEGIMHEKRDGFHFVPRLTQDADEYLNKAEQEVITKTFTMEGAAGQFYLAYSGKGTIINPELQAVLEHPELFGSTGKKKGNPDRHVYVNKKAFINALQQMKDELVQIKPVWVTTLLDPTKIKHYLPKVYSKSQLAAMEIEIQDAVRDQYQGNTAKMLVVLVLIGLVVSVAVAVKVFGFI